MSRLPVADALPQLQALGDPRPTAVPHDVHATSRVLRKLAENWDDAHAWLMWSAVEGWALNEDEATSALYVHARQYVHTTVGDQLPFLMAALREAVKERTDFADDPRSVFDIPLREDAVAAYAARLEQHVIDALLPLTTGQRAGGAR